MKALCELLEALRRRRATLLALALLLGAAGVCATAQVYTDLHDFNGSEVAAFEGSDVLVQGLDGSLYGTVYQGGADGEGTLFKITTDGSFTVLFEFGSIGLEGPLGLTVGPDGTLYGATQVGGQCCGAIFRVTPQGVVQVLYNFPVWAGGPFAGPILALDGNFYGVAQDWYGTEFFVYRLKPTGKLTKQTQVEGRSFGPLIQASDGGLYGTTSVGGGAGTVFKKGRKKPIYSFDNVHGATPESEVIQGSDGNLYGTTTYGGLNGVGELYKLTRGGSLKVLHDFDSHGSDGYEPTAGLVLASDGNFYGVTQTGGGYPYPGVAFSLTPDGTYSKIYTFDSSHGSAPFDTPTQHTNGKIYGMTAEGGAYDRGVIYSLDLGLKPFARLTMKVAQVGQSAGVLGQGFTGATGVTFAGVPVGFTPISDTYLTFTVPAGQAIGWVQVTNASGTLTSNERLRVAPMILGINPTSGPVGTQVKIAGTGLTPVTTVTFGGAKATVFSVDSDSQVTATVPIGAKTGKVIVKTAKIGIYSGLSATSPTPFTVTP